MKTNQPMIDEHYPQVPYPNPPPLPNVNPPLATVGNYPMACICPYCRQTVVTRTEKDAGVLVWVSAAVICVFGCFCGCCLIPFCIDDMKVPNIFKHQCILNFISL